MHDHKDAFEKAMNSSGKKSSGGPKTAKGKRASSQNALVHGATSNKVVSADQKALVERYEHEFTAYYKPDSPLEKLQIQRIALCKAKLDALYELELVKLQIAKVELEGNPKLALDSVYPSEDLTRSFAQNLSKGSQLSLPMNLTPELLETFSKEINSAGGKIDQGDEIYSHIPSLGEFIENEGKRLNTSAYQVILRIGESIKTLLDKGNGNLSVVYEALELATDVMRHRKLGHDAYYFKKDTVESEGDVDIKKVNNTLLSITQLNAIVVKAREVSKEFDRMQDLLLRSVTLGGEESDRLLRYQTTWERRLSSAIGELLALQGKNAH
jgi:hypothetical protein